MELASAHDVASYFLSLVEEDVGDSISNLKLQKLVYYAQGTHLALFDSPLFSECIEAWDHGPVVRSLWQKYRDNGANPIPLPAEVDLSMFTEGQLDLLDEVYDEYGQYSAWKLRNMTHHELPWREAHDRGSGTITHDTMKKFFKTQVR